MATDDAQNTELILDVVRNVTAVGTFAALAYVSYLILDAPVFGAAVGAMMGVGSYLHLPYVLDPEVHAEGADGAAGIDDGAAGAGDGTTGSHGGPGDTSGPGDPSGPDASGDFHGGAAGFALQIGGVAAFALGFVVGPVPQALAGGAALAVLGYVVLATVLPHEWPF